MKTELESSFAQTIAAKIASFNLSGQATSQALVNHINDGREIGLLISEWSQGEFNITFHQTHCLQLDIPFDTMRGFVRIANRLPEPATSLDDVRSVLQLDFQTAGLITMPDSQPTKPSSLTPFILFVNRIGQVRETIAKLGQVKDQDRAALKQQLEPLVAFYQTL